jgi:hypothetical protein
MSKLLAITGTVDLAAAKSGPPKVSILAYTGSVMRVSGWGLIVVDLAGLRTPPQVPLLVDHDASLRGVVGHATPSIVRGQVLASGVLGASSEASKQLVDLAKSGLTWQASVGLDVAESRRVREGETIAVNGRTITAASPFTLVVRSTLKEITVTALGADGDTSVSIAASMAGRKAVSMNFEQWLAAQGWDASTLSETQKGTLKAAYDAEQNVGTNDPVGDMRAEAGRLAAIRATCRNHPDIEAQAVDEGWTREATELAVLRASRSRPPSTTSRHRPEANGSTLEAALLMHLGASDVAQRVFDERTVQAAHDMKVRHVLDLTEMGLRAAHVDPPSGRTDMLRAGFSTNVVPTLLSNVANKVSVDAYQAFPSVARMIAKKLSANDFKTHTGIRLTGSNTMSPVGGAGEIEHGSLEEATHTFSVSTYAKMFALTRQDLINDDLGKLAEVPRIIGIGAGQKLEQVFWEMVLGNAGSFFSDGNGNSLVLALGEAGLASAVELFRKQVDEGNQPIPVVPKYLVVCPELEVTADGLFASTNVVITGDTDTSRTAANVFANKYKPLVAPHLSNTSYSGYSATAWYLVSDPATVAAFGLAYLNNQERPTIESADTDFNTLGVQMRGYFDFGTCLIDPAGAVKSTGVGE